MDGEFPLPLLLEESKFRKKNSLFSRKTKSTTIEIYMDYESFPAVQKKKSSRKKLHGKKRSSTKEPVHFDAFKVKKEHGVFNPFANGGICNFFCPVSGRVKRMNHPVREGGQSTALEQKLR